MKIYILASSDYDLASESSGWTNHQSILESGVPFLSLESAQEDALDWLKEVYKDLRLEGEACLEWEKEENSLPTLQAQTWKACNEEVGLEFQVREYEVAK